MAGARPVQQKKFRSRKHMLPAVALARHAIVVSHSIFQAGCRRMTLCPLTVAVVG